MNHFMILPCQAMFGMVDAARVAALAVQVTGQPCPGELGGTCPLFPTSEDEPKAEVPPPRVAPNGIQSSA